MSSARRFHLKEVVAQAEQQLFAGHTLMETLSKQLLHLRKEINLMSPVASFNDPRAGTIIGTGLEKTQRI